MLVMFLLSFGFILLAYKIWGKMGLYMWIVITTIVANIQTVKTIDIFGVPVVLAVVLYSSSFLSTDILSENYGKKSAEKAVYIGFFAMITMTLLMNLSIYFIPSAEDFGHESIVSIFGFMPRIVLGSFAGYFVSQLHDVNAYEFWRKKLPEDKYLWVRNNFSTMVSQFIDTLIFTIIVYVGVFEFDYIIKLVFSQYIMKVLIAAADTPFLYIAKKMYKKNSLGE